ncbi:MAG: hypothetical protein JW965_03935 [Bacteroidales bacterium]|nr:hypothetical protein [Bacteroidales bacterium]
MCILISFSLTGCISPETEFDNKETVKNQARIVNIVNFIRQCEPRIDWIIEDVLYEPVVEQINIMREYNLKGTFLLQYDALIDKRYQELIKELPPDQFEIGAWWELPQPLVEDSGYKWIGRYQWDWEGKCRGLYRLNLYIRKEEITGNGASGISMSS